MKIVTVYRNGFFCFLSMLKVFFDTFSETFMFFLPFSREWTILYFFFRDLFVGFLFTADIFLNCHWIIKAKFLSFEKNLQFFVRNVRNEFEISWVFEVFNIELWRHVLSRSRHEESVRVRNAYSVNNDGNRGMSIMSLWCGFEQVIADCLDMPLLFLRFEIESEN